MTDPVAELLSNPIVTSAITMTAIVAVALWLAAAWWAYRDAARRTESTLAAFLAAGWIVISTPPLLPIALAIYSVTRPQQTAADHRARALVRQLGAVAGNGAACASCEMPVESGWLRCPTCSSWLAAPCHSCGAWSARDLEACPYCGSEGHAAPVVEWEPASGLAVGAGAAVGVALPARAGAAVGAALPARAATVAGVPMGPGIVVAAGTSAPNPGGAGRQWVAGHGTAAAGAAPAAATVAGTQLAASQRGRVASSARPFSYAASRDTSSISS